MLAKSREAQCTLLALEVGADAPSAQIFVDDSPPLQRKAPQGLVTKVAQSQK